MFPKNISIHYVTDDHHNSRDVLEINILQQIGEVTVVTTSRSRPQENVRKISLPLKNGIYRHFWNIWPRLVFLLSTTPNSKINQEFPARNIYSHSLFSKIALRLWWRLKSAKFLSALLPTYSNLYFLPCKIALFLSKRNKSIPWADIVVYDATLARTPKFAGYLAHQRSIGSYMVANVKSWDNPFTASLDTNADCYLVWSESMWEDIQHTHGKLNAKYVIWGAVPFDGFKQAWSNRSTNPDKSSRILTVGYAAAYPSEPMNIYEEEVLQTLSRLIQENMPDTQIIWRPYPTRQSLSTNLGEEGNISIAGINGDVVDRYGDGKENIVFGSEEQKVNYIGQCDCFLSIGTSFSIEAAISDTPLLQLYLDSENRKTIAERALFGWIDISDHIQKYYIKHLSVYTSYKSLLTALSLVREQSGSHSVRARALLDSLGAHSQISNEDRAQALANQFFKRDLHHPSQ